MENIKINSQSLELIAFKVFLFAMLAYTALLLFLVLLG